MGRTHLKKGDEILLTGMEHHANIVPWQIVAEQTGALIKVIPVNESSEIDTEAFDSLIENKLESLQSAKSQTP